MECRIFNQLPPHRLTALAFVPEAVYGSASARALTPYRRRAPEAPSMTRERQFINDQLVTTKRFNPAAAPAHSAESQPVARTPAAPLPTTAPPVPDAIAPATPAASSAAPPSAPAAQADADAATGIGPLLRREHDTLQAGLLDNERSEYQRRREEVLRQLDDSISAVAQDKLAREARLRLLVDVRGQVELQTPESALELSPAQLRTARRTVENAHLERLKAEAEEPAAPPRGQSGHVELCSLSLAQLTRLGLGLTWPLIAGLLLAAIIVATALGLVF